MLETAILEIQIFKHFWGSMPPEPWKARAFGTCGVPPPFWKSWIHPWEWGLIEAGSFFTNDSNEFAALL